MVIGNEEINKEDAKNIPFKLKNNTYHIKITKQKYECMQQWLMRFDAKKGYFKAQYPTLEEKHYENMSFIWLLGELAEFDKKNLSLYKKNHKMEDKIKMLSQEIDKAIQK